MGAMKTQVIQLVLHDDVVSVRDRMSWAKTERILLVFPRRSRIVDRPLDLLLIQRHAARLGAQLAIVARSRELRRTAKELGVPAFPTAASAQRQVWATDKVPASPQRRRERPDLNQLRREAFPPDAHWKSRDGFRFSIFSLAVLAILAVLSLFIPSASIQINPALQLQSLTLPVSASPGVTTVNLAGSLPAHSSSLVVERNRSVPTTGSITVPEAQAQGSVRFRNLTTAQTVIPSGTVVSTQANPPVRFTTTKEATVPAGFGKTVEVPVQALVGGASGNLSADTLIVFEEAGLGTSLAATNPKPTTGGTDRLGAIQTSKDRSSLRAALVKEILAECQTGFQQALAPGDIVFPDTLSVSQVLSETWFPAEGQSSETLSLTLRLQCQEQYAAQADVHALAGMSLDASLPVGFVSVPGGLQTQPVSTPLTARDGVTHWDLQAQRILSARLDPLRVQQAATGHTPPVAVLRLNQALLLGGAPVIKVKPDWWPWLPLIPFRITVSAGG
jgi:hypothetical protein